MREHLRVTPTSEELAVGDVQTTLASLHKLTTDGSSGLLGTLSPFSSTRPPRFEFLAISEGPDQPVEFYYGADEHLDTLEARIQSIYPSSFDIERVEIDLLRKLIPPTEYSREEFVEALTDDRLLYEFSDSERQALDPNEKDEEEETNTAEAKPQPPTADGGVTADSKAEVDSWVEIGDTAVKIADPCSVPEGSVRTVVDRPTLTEDGTILARPTTDSLRPVGVQWYGNGARKRDWMTALVPFSEASSSEETSDSTIVPLATLIDRLSEAEHPVVFQAIFQRHASWESDAELRKEDLANGRDTLAQRIIGSIIEVDDYSLDRSERELSDQVEKRIDCITDKEPKRTFSVNLRAVAVPPEGAEIEEAQSSMDSLRSVFDPLDGSFYGLDGQRLRNRGWRQATKEKHARKSLRQLLDRELTTGSGKTRPDLVLNADELANFVVVPSAADLSVEGVRGTRAEQQSRNPLSRPHQDLMGEFRDGMAIGYALDENGEPEDVPTHIPPRLLPTHYGRFGTTGSGKSKALINDALSLYANTEGPVIVIDPKGDGMTENYMKAHARRFGMTDLVEHVIHFSIPDILPGFSFFDIEPALESGQRREDAVQRKADHYEEILKLVMGEGRYARAIVPGTLIKTLVKALFDEEHGRENGLYRESTNYFAHRQLEYVVDQLWHAGPPQPNLAEAPQSSDEEVFRTIQRQLQLDSNTFANIMGGVANRLAYISQDAHLRRIFNNTENQFDFRDVLDEDKVILFDLGDLRDDSARIMTGLILSNLNDALKDRKRDLSQYPDEYVVNLIIDEAASVVVSDIMNDFLEKGRSFRLSVGLSMQFPEQMEAEGGRKIYLNSLNNIGSSLVGKVNVDRELAQAMAHEEMDPTEFANRIRSLPRGEWIASLPSPTFGETGPYPFSVDPLPIPPGHPESDYPLTEREEDRFTEVLESIHHRANTEFGVPTSSAPTLQTPEALHDVLDVADDDLDVAIAKVVRSMQLREGVHEDNGWVSVEDVDDEIRRLFEDADAETPSFEELTAIRQRSQYLDATVDVEADEVVVRLTEEGEEVAKPDTGGVRAAGGNDHDAVLIQIEEELTTLGFTVSILSQDGREMPDARATHPEVDGTFAIEVETTTPENPAKILANLRKAQEAGEIPLFVVRPGKTDVAWAKRVEGILSPPMRELQSGERRYYNSDSDLTFNGGATEVGGVTAVRPVKADEDNAQSIWKQDGNDIVYCDAEGTEYIRFDSFDSLSKDRVPAIYSYDQTHGEYVVHEHGERHVYESKGALESDWIRVKRPVIPEHDLPCPDYERSTFSIVILHEETGSVIYKEGSVQPLSTLVEDPPRPPAVESKGDEQAALQNTGLNSGSKGEQSDESPFESFVSNHLVEDEEAIVAKADVYDCYLDWADRQGIDDPLNKSWFTRKLNNHLDVGSKRVRVDGDLVRHYTRIRLWSEQDSQP